MGKTTSRGFTPSATPGKMPYPDAVIKLLSAMNCKIDKLVEALGGLSGKQQVIITTKEEKSAHMNDRYVTVKPTAPMQILGDNPDRKKFLLCNDGIATVYLSEQNTVTAPGGSHKGFPLLAGTYYNSGSYTGPLFGITAAANVDVAVIEEV